MSYRIEVPPLSGQLFHSLSPHVVLHFGRQLAEVAAELGGAEPGVVIPKGAPRQFRLEIEGCSLLYEIDRRARTVSVLDVLRGEPALAAS